MPKPQSALTLFVISQPETLTAAEVVEKAKEAGFTTNPDAVKQTRRRAKQRAAKKTAGAPKAAKKQAPKPKAAAKSAAKKPTSKKTTAKSGLSKSDYIRSQPASLTANEVVAKAKEAGIKLDPVLVYKVRARAKNAKPVAEKAAPSAQFAAKAPAVAAAKAAPAAKKAVTKKAAPSTNGSGKSATSAEDLLRAVASEIGLARAISILEDQRRQVLRVLGG